MAEVGRISDPRKFKKLQGKLFEFKRFQIRVACFQIGNRWILTQGFVKKSDAWPRKEIERAEQIMEEHLAREGKKGKYDK